jgi:hypothetical protein
MTLQVVSSSTKARGVVHGVTNGSVAVVAQKTAHSPGCVIVVNVELLIPPGRRAPADLAVGCCHVLRELLIRDVITTGDELPALTFLAAIL